MFTRYLVDGLKTGEADTDADGRITLDELYDYVYPQVVSSTAYLIRAPGLPAGLASS